MGVNAGAAPSGLRFPTDLEAWWCWQRGRHVLRRARDAVRRPGTPGPFVLHLRVAESDGGRGMAFAAPDRRDPALTRGSADPTMLFALDATTPTALASVLGPLAHLGGEPVAVLAPADVSARLPGAWSVAAVDPGAAPVVLRSVRTVVSAGHFLPVGHAAFGWALARGWRYVVVQHGLLTPFMAPLPERAHLLAFSERDADYWRAGRADVTSEVVGSQLLWNAAAGSASAAPSRLGKRRFPSDRATSSATGAEEAGRGSAPPVFLGQLHGAELPRRISAATASAFCRAHGALYRPHPAEVDRLSRWQHARWQRQGIRFAGPGALSATRGPVVSIFSTGVLEAAAAGRDAWVTCVRPPDWVREFWDRYELSVWGGSATAAPLQPDVEPARAIADAVRGSTRGGLRAEEPRIDERRAERDRATRAEGGPR